MAARTPADLRERAVAAVETGMARPEVARAFGVSPRSVERWLARARHVWLPAGVPPPPPRPAGFRVLPRRWVVERTFARLGRSRRLSQDDEARPASEEAWIYAASCRVLLRRLAR